MSDLSIYFSPIELRETPSISFDDQKETNNQLKNLIDFHSENSFPDWGKAEIAIFGVNEGRGSINNSDCDKAPAEIRTFLYDLYKGSYNVNIVDLGNVQEGATKEDTNFAISNIVSELLKKKVIPIIIGGSQDLTYANYLAYEKLEQTINLVTIDPKFDLGTIDDALTSESYLGKIILHQPNFLFNYANIGYQTYFVDQKTLDLMSKLFFDTHRLGSFRNNIQSAEPIIRNADIVSFDLSAIKSAESPANSVSNPNGFSSEDACQLARYAGMSDKLTSVGFYECNPEYDINGLSSHLIAQMIWCFIDGYCNRKNDFPAGTKANYTKYTVSIKEDKNQLIFYKSDKSDRWWIEVPYPSKMQNKYERHHMVPCSYLDYELAAQEEIPDIWWKTYQKLSY